MLLADASNFTRCVPTKYCYKHDRNKQFNSPPGIAHFRHRELDHSSDDAGNNPIRGCQMMFSESAHGVDDEMVADL